MKSRLLLALALLPILAQADQSIYSDELDSGWANWSWASVAFDNTAYHHGGAKSIAVTAGPYQAIFLHHDPINAANFDSISFWVNGGPVGGQSLLLQATLSSTAQPGYFLPAIPANTWTHFTVPLSALHVAGQPNFDGFWLQDTTGLTSPTYYLDDLSLTEPAPPNPILVNVDMTRPIQKMDARMFGVNTAVWDNQVSSATTRSLLVNAGINYLRFPGGSLSDTYHWATNQTNDGTYWATDFNAFTSSLKATKSRAMITTNYGTGTADEAAAWVQQANIVMKLGITEWEVGNECFGTWEADNHAAKNDPYTYAQQYAIYRQKMKAVDPRISVGAVIPLGEDSFVNNTDHPATNPRTHVVHNGFAPVMLATLKSLGVTPDFVIYHYYAQNPGGESDDLLLNSPSNWQPDMQQIHQMLTDYLGSRNVIPILVTENNSVSYNPGKQSTSLVNALYLAESFGYLTQTEARSFVWWDLRNGQDGSQNNSASLYGWRQYGDYGIVSPQNDRYPVYYAMRLIQNFARSADVIYPVTTSYYRLAAFACLRGNGTLSLMVINKNPTNIYNAQFSITGFTPQSAGTTFSYGIPQDQAAQTGVGSADIAIGTLSGLGPVFTASFPPYSITVIQLKRS